MCKHCVPLLNELFLIVLDLGQIVVFVYIYIGL